MSPRYLNPTRVEVIAARERAGLTPEQAAAMIRSSVAYWRDCEAEVVRWTGASRFGVRRMHPGLYELFLIKTEQALTDRGER